MIRPRLLILSAMALGLGTGAAHAYQAQFERDIGAIPACDVTFKPSDSATVIGSELNGGDSDRVFCFSPGDYRSLGTLSLTRSGTASAQRWIRLSTAGDTHPVKLESAQRATIRGIKLTDESYWIFHRMAIDGGNGSSSLVDADSGATNNIFDHMLMERSAATTMIQFRSGTENHTIQNSVVRKGGPKVGQDVVGVNLMKGTRIINSEFYDIGSKFGQAQPGTDKGNIVIENSDFYYTSAFRTNCSGSFTPSGNCVASEAFLTFKGAASSSSDRIRIINNRFWGGRNADTDACCAGGGGRGQMISLSADKAGAKIRYVEIVNNVFMDGTRAIQTNMNDGDSIDHISIIGNLVYDMTHGTSSSEAMCFNIDEADRVEGYFNSCIQATRAGQATNSTTNQDWLCNVFVDANSNSGTSAPSSTVWNYNAWYNTASYTTAGGSGDIVYGSNSASNHEAYTMTRRPWTGPETVSIPRARPTLASPHAYACGVAVGARSGIGVDDRSFR